MSLPAAAEISVIVVNYGTAELALEAVGSVLSRGHGGRGVDVHLVDNASPGDDATTIAAAIERRGWSDRVTFYPEAVNHGFGGGNNVALEALARRATPPDKVFLLNPDARLGNEAIADLADVLDARGAAVAGARIEKPDGTPVTAAFRFPGATSVFEGAVTFGPVSRLLSRWQVSLPPGLPTSRVDWVSGAAAMFRFDAIRAAGGFDPAYFLYYEEVDLMRQIARTGGETWYVAEALVVHSEGAATGVRSGGAAPRRPAYWYASWHHYFRKNHGRLHALAAAAVWAAGAAGGRSLAWLLRRPSTVPQRFFRDFWAMAGRPLVGLEAQPYE
jgi:GT2 family glycosyltransferase